MLFTVGCVLFVLAWWIDPQYKWERFAELRAAGAIILGHVGMGAMLASLLVLAWRYLP